MSLRTIYDNLSGRCVREIDPSLFNGKSLYLTFDDGPDPHLTEDVLNLLHSSNSKATFFVIANRALEHKSLIKKMLDAGHAIGNHSLDHNTNNYFKGTASITKWLRDSQNIFEKELNVESVGFRSPVGIKTPPLNTALSDLGLLNVLWSIRYYDTTKVLTKDRIVHRLDQIVPGSIILLHDTNSGEKKELFLEGLLFLISSCLERGFTFKPLSGKLVKDSYRLKYNR